MSLRRECRNDQAREHQVDADELHRGGHGERERAVEAVAPGAPDTAERERRREQRRDEPQPRDLRRIDPEDLAHQQVLQVLAAVRIAREQKHAGAGGQHEDRADQRFLLLRRAPLGPCEQPCARQRGRHRRGLHRDAAVGQSERVGGDHPDPRDLRDGKVREDDAAIEHLRA